MGSATSRARHPSLPPTTCALAAKRRIMRSMRFILRVIALMLLAATSSLSQPRAKPASSAVDAGALDAGLGAPSSRVDAGAGPSEKAPAPPAPSAERLELDRLRLELTKIRAGTHSPRAARGGSRGRGGTGRAARREARGAARARHRDREPPGRR